MKTILKPFRVIRRFFALLILKLTPAGRKELMYDEALKNMKEAHLLTTLERRILKSQIHFYINNTLKRKHISGFQMGQLVSQKFSKELEGSNLRYDAKNYRMVDRIEQRKKNRALKIVHA